MYNNNFWKLLDKLVQESEIVIDRPKGTCHPKFPETIYQVDYGYIKNTKSSDSEEIDVFVGTLPNKLIDSIAVTFDLLNKDSEIIILIGCTNEENYLHRNNIKITII